VDLLENIDIEEMKLTLLEFVAGQLGYEQDDWWFDVWFGVEYPQPTIEEPKTWFDHEVT